MKCRTCARRLDLERLDYTKGCKHETMTKAEAIEWLIQIKDKYIYGGDEGFDAKRKEALDMAVEVLKKGLKGEAFGETLIITVDDYSKVNRVIVKGEGHFGCVFEPIYDDEEQPTINQWIPCSERLPEMCENVLLIFR